MKKTTKAKTAKPTTVAEALKSAKVIAMPARKPVDWSAAAKKAWVTIRAKRAAALAVAEAAAKAKPAKATAKSAKQRKTA